MLLRKLLLISDREKNISAAFIHWIYLLDWCFLQATNDIIRNDVLEKATRWRATVQLHGRCRWDSPLEVNCYFRLARGGAELNLKTETYPRNEGFRCFSPPCTSYSHLILEEVRVENLYLRDGERRKKTPPCFYHQHYVYIPVRIPYHLVFVCVSGFLFFFAL